MGPSPCQRSEPGLLMMQRADQTTWHPENCHLVLNAVYGGVFFLGYRCSVALDSRCKGKNHFLGGPKKNIRFDSGFPKTVQH